MVDQRSAPAPKPQKRRRKRIRPPEEVWVQAFMEFTGTDGVTGFCADDLGGVSLTRIVEALRLGSMSWSDKCNGAGSICGFEHVADEADAVEVVVWFNSTEDKLEIRAARRIMEDEGEPNAA